MATNFEKEQDQVVNEIETLDKRVKVILWIGAPLLILIPIVTTQLDWSYNFTETGQIGDTIGGITAPVIGVVSALLIYFSFRAQINANRIIQMQINDQKKDENEKKEFNNLMELYRHLKEALERFSYIIGNEEITGNKAIHRFLSLIIDRGTTQQVSSGIVFDSIIKLFNLLIDKLEISIKNNIEVDFILTMLEHQFQHYIWAPHAEKIIKILLENKNDLKSIRVCNTLNNLNSRIIAIQII